jgi:uncharacterized protein (TIGR00290 family)
LSWSGGKDCAWALHLLRQSGEFEIVGLLTTLNETFRRIAIHGVRETLLEQQAAAAGLPLWKIDLPFPCSNEIYEARMQAALARAKAEGVEGVAFGDLFLEDIRAYRERMMAEAGLRPLFPVWDIPTAELAREMIAAGVRATLVTVDPRRLSRSFAGRQFDAALLSDLPPDVDPCGERGEFHTFVSSGPMFGAPIEIRAGQVIERDGFVFADLLGREDDAS